MFRRIACWVRNNHEWVIFQDSYKHKYHQKVCHDDHLIGTLAACHRCGLVRNDLPTDTEDAKYKTLFEDSDTYSALRSFVDGAFKQLEQLTGSGFIDEIKSFLKKVNAKPKNGP